MNKIFLILLVVILNYPNFAKEKSFDLGITGYAANIAFPAFDIDFNYSFYNKGIHSVAFTTTLFTMVKGNAAYKPTFVMFGPLMGVQYSLVTKTGFLFALNTGLGVVGEFFMEEVYSEDSGFYKNPGVLYGMFSAGSRIGYDFTEKYNVPMQLSFVFSYRMQFPFNLNINHIVLLGIGLSYSFDLNKKNNKKLYNLDQ